MSDQITRIVEYRNRDTIDVLETILEKARAGEVTGMIFALRYGASDHGVGVTGTYDTDPIAAASVAGRILKILSNRADKMVRKGALKRKKATVSPIKPKK